MMLLRRSIPRALLFVGVATIATASLGGTSTARATESRWLTTPGGLPLFDLDEIAPGDSGSAILTVSNPQPFAVTFSIGVTGLSNDDNGCNEPEQAIGDTTCGSGGGELQSDLRLTLTAKGAADRLIADGTVDEWAARPLVDALPFSGYESRSYRVGYELPIGTTNVTQSDLVSFLLEGRLDQTLDTVASEAPPVIIVATPSLPRTGTEPDAMLMIGLATVLVGFGLVAMSARRRRRSQ